MIIILYIFVEARSPMMCRVFESEPSIILRNSIDLKYNALGGCIKFDNQNMIESYTGPHV